MTYDEAIEYIYSRRKFQKSNGLERMERLLELLGEPHSKLRFIHVVGTNGKGSVSTALSNILAEAGYTVGLFTSPFVVEFGERIRVNGRFMPKDSIARDVALIKEKLDIMEKEGLYPTVFEVTTALGMLHFYQSNCDYVVLEAGIGGGHDSTNVIPSPLAAVFTHISIDHADMLGDTSEKIAHEKSGIIKKGTTVVAYPCDGEIFTPQKESVTDIIKSKATELGCDFLSYRGSEVQVIRSDITGSTFIFDKLEIHTPLCGAHQIGNMLTVLAAARVLKEKGVGLSDENIREGIAKTRMPARTETVSQEPLIILDGGHNEGCMRALAEVIGKYLKDKNIIMLMALMADKDVDKVIEAVAPLCGEMVMTNVDPIRGERADTLKNKAEKYCERVTACEEGEKAFLQIRERLSERDVLIVAGSFYLASEIRNKFFT